MEVLREKYTVRNISEDAIQKVREVAFHSDLQIGHCITEAILYWHESLKEDDFEID